MTTTLTTAQTSALVAMATGQREAYTATGLGSTGSTMQALLRRGLVARSNDQWTSALAYLQNAEYYTLTTAGLEAVAPHLVQALATELGAGVEQTGDAVDVVAPDGLTWTANNLHTITGILYQWGDDSEAGAVWVDVWERMRDGLSESHCEDSTCETCTDEDEEPVSLAQASQTTLLQLLSNAGVQVTICNEVPNAVQVNTDTFTYVLGYSEGTDTYVLEYWTHADYVEGKLPIESLDHTSAYAVVDDLFDLFAVTYCERYGIIVSQRAGHILTCEETFSNTTYVEVINLATGESLSRNVKRNR